MARSFDNLWGQVLRRSTKAVRLVRLFDSLLRQAEISYSYMALRIQKNILWLEVPINDILLMKRLNSTNYFGCVQLCTRLIELLLLTQVGEEFTAVQEVNEEVQLALSLESEMQADDVGVLNLFEDVSFG